MNLRGEWRDLLLLSNDWIAVRLDQNRTLLEVQSKRSEHIPSHCCEHILQPTLLGTFAPATFHHVGAIGVVSVVAQAAMIHKREEGSKGSRAASRWMRKRAALLSATRPQTAMDMQSRLRELAVPSPRLRE